jgi:RHS repeat-associated protein
VEGQYGAFLYDTDGDGIPDGIDALPQDGIVFHHGDHLGSTTVLTALQGTEVQRVVYKPFGDTASGQAPAFGFTGQRFEANLGIYDYGARWYDPALGRFLSADAVVEAPYNPQTFNRYSYVRNSPTNRVDPTGNYSEIYGWGTVIPGVDYGPGPMTVQERYEYLSSPVYWGGTDLGLTDLPPAFIVIPEGGGVVIDLEALAAGLASEYEMMWQSYEYEMRLREARRAARRPSLLDAPRTGSGSSFGVTETTGAIAGGVSTYGSFGQYSHVRGGQWRGANNKWNSLDWGGNQRTGRRTTVIWSAQSFRALSKAFFLVGAGVGAVEGGAAIVGGDAGRAAKAGTDVSFGYLGIAGGPWGAAASGAYWAIDLTVGWDWMPRTQSRPGLTPLWDGISP